MNNVSFQQRLIHCISKIYIYFRRIDQKLQFLKLLFPFIVSQYIILKILIIYISLSS